MKELPWMEVMYFLQVNDPSTMGCQSLFWRGRDPVNRGIRFGAEKPVPALRLAMLNASTGYSPPLSIALLTENAV